MPTLYYTHDPMCSWCWGFSKTWNAVKKSLPTNIETKYLVGGLAPDSEEPMPADMQEKLLEVWRSIQEGIPGTEFNFDFWEYCKPRRSTYPACRAVLTAKQMDNSKEDEMISGIQNAYYLNAKNPSDLSTLVEVGQSIGLDDTKFTQLIQSPIIEQQLHHNIKTAQSMGGVSFPSLFLEFNGKDDMGMQNVPISIDYNSPDKIISAINQYLN